MQIGTKEHQGMITSFEKNMNGLHLRCRFDKESKEMWRQGHVYQCGRTNEYWRVFCAGYANARCVYQN